MKLEIKGDYRLHFGDYTLCLYTPKLEVATSKKYEDQFHIGLATQILYRRPRTGWSWHWSFVFRVLGFGFGVAHQHCENPNWEKKAREQNLECKR